MVGIDPIYVLVVNGADVTTKMYENSASMTYTDNDGDQADSLDIKIAGKWDIVKFTDTAELWLGYASSNVWHVGTFVVQSVTVGAFQSTIKATSANFNNGLKEKNNTVYKAKSIKKIVEEIATRQGLKSRCNVEGSLEYLLQQNENDIHFLTRLAKDSNAIFKIKKNELIFVSRDKTNTHIIDVAECYGDGPVVDFNNRTIYGSAITEYWDTKENSVKSVRVGTGSPVLKVDEHFESRAEALRVLESKLKSENRGKVSGSLTIYGIDVVAGNKLELKGDKRFEGLKFGITRVTHSVGDGGFSTGLEFEG